MKGPSKMENYSHVQIDRMDNKERKKYDDFLKAHDHPHSAAAKAAKKSHKKAGKKHHSLAEANPEDQDDNQKEDFAEGLTDAEHDFKTTIRMKEPEGLRKYKYSQTHTKKAKKGKKGDDFAEGLTDAEHDFKTTIRMKEPEGLRKYNYGQKRKLRRIR